jgi:hypothetical protein
VSGGTSSMMLKPWPSRRSRCCMTHRHTAQTMWMIEDEAHAEPQGEFDSLDNALGELRRRADMPWDVAPNVAPCASWRTCGRRYGVVEFDTAESPWREIQRIPSWIFLLTASSGSSRLIQALHHDTAPNRPLQPSSGAGRE